MISLPPAVLSSMKTAAQALMTDTCKIEVLTNAIGEMGEQLQDQYSTVSASVACRVITIGNRFREQVASVGNRETIVDSYRLICPAGTALAVDQRITLASDGSQWEVVDLVTARTDAVDAQAVIVKVNG
jgi:hypothetical protein